MPKPFVKMNVGEFEELVNSFSFTRTITEVHMHHTWRPNHGQYRGLPTIDAMWEFHTQENGWSDIAQHISIAPDGAIWSGRNWNRPPASAAGFNGNSGKGPFMFEMIGDFDKGKDPFADPQRAAVIRVIVAVLKRFSLPVSALKFHNQMTDAKSCPGTSIAYDAFCKEVQTALSAAGKSTAAKKRGGASRAVEELRNSMEEELPEEDLAAPEFRADHLHFKEESFASRAPLSGAAAATAKAHLINLRDGQLSNSGVMSTSDADLEALFQVHLADALEDAKAEGRPLRLMFFAHGGLNDEKGAVNTAISRVPWWLSNGIYPIFFIWETGLLETWGQMLERSTKDMWGKIGGIFGRRGFFDFVADHATDPAIEDIARSIGGVGTWGAMKNSAERASASGSGGAWHTARLLKDFLKTAKGHPVELHAIGHSAGSIFHAHFLAAVNAALGAAGPTIKTLHHLAPAIRVDLFKQKVMPLLGKGIDSLTLYTMTDAKEREDTCMKVYKKSLLYLIHKGLEPENPCHLVGLQQSVRGDGALRKLFEPAAPGVAEVIWSPVEGGPRHSSKSLTHGGFDDEPLTMNSVCRRILGTDKIKEYPTGLRGVADSESEVLTHEQAAMGRLMDYAMKKFGSVPVAVQEAEESPSPSPSIEAPAVVRPASVKKRALCIGIDNYPDEGDRLSGCVNDARNWQRFFDESGFKTQMLLDEAASYAGIVDAFGELVSSAKAGEVIAIVYAGHGVQVRDMNDEEDDDGLDEALCCHDFRTGRLVLDDELGELLTAAKEGVDLSLFLDSCHSGSANRATPIGVSPLKLPEGTKKRAIPRSTALDDANAAFRGRNGKKGAKKVDKQLDILFSAALPAQFANEVGGSGVFTSAAMKILRKTGGKGMTNAAFDEAVRKAFPAEFRAIQESRLYGSDQVKAKAFLGGL